MHRKAYSIKNFGSKWSGMEEDSHIQISRGTNKSQVTDFSQVNSMGTIHTMFWLCLGKKILITHAMVGLFSLLCCAQGKGGGRKMTLRSLIVLGDRH